MVSLCGILSLWAFEASNSANKKIKVSVVNEENKGVPGIVEINRGLSWERFGRTDGDGVLEQTYTCRPGEALKATPDDQGQYFSSRDENCVEKAVLRVIKRETPIGQASAASQHIIQVMVKGKPADFAVITKGIVQSDIEEPADGTCRVTVQPLLETSVYELGPAGAWKQVKSLTDTSRVGDTGSGAQFFVERTFGDRCAQSFDAILHFQDAGLQVVQTAVQANSEQLDKARSDLEQLLNR
jgi:hypothetical protein